VRTDGCRSGFIKSWLTLTIGPATRSWTQALGWVLSETDRKIVPGPDKNAPACASTPVTDTKPVKNRLHVDLTSSAQDRDQEIERLKRSTVPGLMVAQLAGGKGASGPGARRGWRGQAFRCR
jgi:hypothetical protein